MPETTSPPEHLFESDSRSVKAMIGVACYLTFVAALWLVFDAVLWIVVLLALLGIPALIQLWKNPHAALTLSYEEVAWSSGAQQGTVLLSGIDKIRMDNIKFFKENVPKLLEVSIGHALISESLYFGIENVINMYKNRLQ